MTESLTKPSIKTWDHTAVFHKRIGKLLFQVNVPKKRSILELEVVAFDNGTVVDREVFSSSIWSKDLAIESLHGYIKESW